MKYKTVLLILFALVIDSLQATRSSYFYDARILLMSRLHNIVIQNVSTFVFDIFWKPEFRVFVIKICTMYN